MVPTPESLTASKWHTPFESPFMPRRGIAWTANSLFLCYMESWAELEADACYFYLLMVEKSKTGVSLFPGHYPVVALLHI